MYPMGMAGHQKREQELSIREMLEGGHGWRVSRDPWGRGYLYEHLDREVRPTGRTQWLSEEAAEDGQTDELRTTQYAWTQGRK